MIIRKHYTNITGAQMCKQNFKVSQCYIGHFIKNRKMSIFFLKHYLSFTFKFHKLVLVNIHPCRQLMQVVNQSADRIGSFREPYLGRVSDFYTNSILNENEGQLGTAMCHQVLCETW